MTDRTYLPHEQRVLDEKTALDTKLAALEAFFKGPLFASLDHEERLRLAEQQFHMACYSMVLGKRIEAFPLPEAA